MAHYPVEHREKAEKAIDFAEQVYDTITNRYKIKLPSKVNLVFNNGLFSNGEANPVYNMMQIWLTNWDFKVRSSHSWISDVITHEFSHLASIQNASKTPLPWIQGLQISKSDFFNQKKQLSAAAYIPFTIMPIWFAEGTAQFESYRMGFDGWDTHRDMLLRIAFLENKVLPLEFMEDFSEQSLEAELGPYTQGFDMVRYIAQTYGENTIPELWKDMGKLSNWTLSAALKNRLNVTEKELYKNWKANRKAHYEKVRDSLGMPIAGKKITKDAFYNDFISPINGSLYGLSNFDGDFFDGGVFEIRDSILDTLKEQIVPGAFEKFKLKKPFLSQGMSIKQTKDGPLIAYASYQNRDKNGRPYFDIAIADTLGNNRAITKFADAVYPDISPDGKQVVFARREENGTRFYLSVADIDDDTRASQARPQRDLVAPVGTEFNIYNPKFSPDGKKIAYSYFDGTKRKIGIWDMENILNSQLPASGCSVASLCVSILNSDNRDPSWSLDGKSIYFSSDETGIFNIYKMDLETKKIEKITKVLGGAFSPIADSSGLYYVGYDRDGFSVYVITDTEPHTPYPIPHTPYASIPHTPKNAESGISFANSERGYLPIPKMPIIVPLFAFDDRAPDFGAVNTGIMVPKIGLAFGLNDPLNKNFFQMAALQQIGKFGEDSQSDLFAGLENRSFPITLNLALMRMNTVSKDTVRCEAANSCEAPLLESEYASELYSALFSASYSVFKKGDSLTVFASYDKQAFNLYQDGFRWDYHKRWQAGLIAALAIADSVLSLQGLYSFASSDLFRPGTFLESFTISDMGVIKPHYRHFYLHEWAGSAELKISRFTLSLFGNGILNWKSPDSDTLDNFYMRPLVIEGYPILKDSESYFKQGTRIVLADVRYKFPIYSDFRKRFGIFTTRNFSVSPFAQMGRVWHDEWLRSFGFEWSLENRLFYSVPFNFNFGAARGLDAPKSARIKISLGF